MPYEGTLNHATAHTLEVTTASTNADSVAVTVSFLKAGGIVDLQMATVAIGTKFTASHAKVSQRIERLVVAVALPRNSMATVRLTQGATMFEETLEEDGELVWDLRDA